MNRTDDIRVGLIGFGFVGRTFHGPLISATPGYRITVVGSSRPEAVHQQLPDVAVVEPSKVICRDDVDLVVVASPNDSHVPLAEAALAAGKHVVVDKPFTIELADARRLAAIRTDRVLSVFHNRRWDSDYLTVRRAIDENVLGPVTLFESHFDRFRPGVGNRWREDGSPGSGLLYDLGPHLIDQVMVLFGPPESVQATLALQRPGARSVDYAHVVLRYPRTTVLLQAGLLIAGGTPRFAVHGPNGSLIKSRPDIQEDQLKAGIHPGTGDWGLDPDTAMFFDGTNPPTPFPTPRGDQRQYYMRLRDAILGHGPNPVPADQASAVMAVIDAATRSDAEGRRIDVDFTPTERAAWDRPVNLSFGSTGKD